MHCPSPTQPLSTGHVPETSNDAPAEKAPKAIPFGWPNHVQGIRLFRRMGLRVRAPKRTL